MKTNKNHRHYYVAHSYMGLNYAYDSPCWCVYAFDTQKERDEYINEYQYSENGNLIMEMINYTIACKIAPDLKYKNPHIARKVIHVYLINDEYGKWIHESS